MDAVLHQSILAARAPVCPAEDDVGEVGRRLEGKLKRLLAATPVPAKNLERRRIAHTRTLQVRSDFDEESNVHFIHGVNVLRLARKPCEFPPLLLPIDLVSLLCCSGDRPADEAPDSEVRAAADHLRRQTLSYLAEQQHRVAPNALLGPGWRTEVEMEVLNFCDIDSGVVTLLTHVVIEIGRVEALKTG